MFHQLLVYLIKPALVSQYTLFDVRGHMESVQ